MSSLNFRTNVISRRKAGISNLIGALLLIVVTLAIAGGVAAYSFGLMGSSSSNISAMITTASATYVVSSSSTTVTISVKNTGTEAWQAVAVSVDGAVVTGYTWAPVPASATPIAAGFSISTTFSKTLAEGTSHTLSVTVTGVSGSTYTTTQSVTVQ